MGKTVFIGVDVSKSKLDISLTVDGVSYDTFVLLMLLLQVAQKLSIVI